MKCSGLILRFVTCAAVFVGQVLCSGGVSYCRSGGLCDGFSEVQATDAGEPSQSVPCLASNDFVQDSSDSMRLGAETASYARNPLALKVNLLYSLLLIPEIGVEYGFGDGWSVGGGWMYGWWKRENAHRYWRAYGGHVFLRKYLRPDKQEKPLSGHHVGVYAQLLTYDFEFGGKGQMAGRPGGSLWDSANYGVGVEYGFSLPVSRALSFDFSLGVGYLGGTYYEYTPMNGHYVWDATKSRHWFGPTKAEVSLVWQLDPSLFGLRKGGRR